MFYLGFTWVSAILLWRKKRLKALRFASQSRKNATYTAHRIIESIWEDRYDDRDAFADFMNAGYKPRLIDSVLEYCVADDYSQYLKARKSRRL